MHLTETGEIVVHEWLNTPVIRPDMNIALDEFVLMPNHFHGIIIIGNNRFNNRSINVDINNGTRKDAMPGVSPINTTPNVIDTTPTGIRDARHCVSTNTNTNTNAKTNNQNQFGPQAKNLSSIIRGFKSAVTINVRKINPYFGWQPRFHEHIIRDYGSYQKIQDYIIDNPKKWELDDYWK